MFMRYSMWTVWSSVILHYDVTCIGQLEGDEITEKQCRRLGFEEGGLSAVNRL